MNIELSVAGLRCESQCVSKSTLFSVRATRTHSTDSCGLGRLLNASTVDITAVQNTSAADGRHSWPPLDDIDTSTQRNPSQQTLTTVVVCKKLELGHAGPGHAAKSILCELCKFGENFFFGGGGIFRP